jgi:hypothetical protein
MDYYFTLQMLIVDLNTERVIGGQAIPLSTEGDTYEDARAKALEYGQSVLRGYDEKGEYALMRLMNA